jgi:WD40 repeat protein
MQMGPGGLRQHRTQALSQLLSTRAHLYGDTCGASGVSRTLRGFGGNRLHAHRPTAMYEQCTPRVGEVVSSIVFPAGGRRLVSGGLDRTVRIWNVDTGAELLMLKGHAARVWAATYTRVKEHLFRR